MWKLGDVGVWLEADLVLCGYGRARECWMLILSFREFVRIMYMSCIEQCHRSGSVSGEHGKVTFHIGTLQIDRNAGKRRSILGFRDIWGGIDRTGNICDAFGPWLLWRWLVNGAIGGNKEVLQLLSPLTCSMNQFPQQPWLHPIIDISFVRSIAFPTFSET